MELPWLRPAQQRLRAMRDRLPHALLIEGPSGWGQARLANGFALELMALPEGRAAREVAHPDLRWIEPDGGTIKIDMVRRVIDFLTQTPQLAGRKVAVIQDAERMNLNAANALLKTLEEPPAESFLALSTSASERLLATVRSRCQRLAIRPLDDDALLAWLLDQGAPAETCGYLAVEYGGAPLAVLEAVRRKQPPLWPTLAGGAAAANLVDRHGDADLADIAARWLRIACWLARRQPLPELLGFVDELATVRRLALLNPGLNRGMQLRRLALLWANVWPLFSRPDPPLLRAVANAAAGADEPPLHIV